MSSNSNQDDEKIQVPDVNTRTVKVHQVQEVIEVEVYPLNIEKPSELLANANASLVSISNVKHSDNTEIKNNSNRSTYIHHSTSTISIGIEGDTTSLPSVLPAYFEWISNWCRISVPAIAFVGCQIAWALQNAFVTPELQELGLDESLVSTVWLAGPITAIVIQPLIGVTSDSLTTSQCGRRRPFIFGGVFLLILSLELFSNAHVIGVYCGDTDDDTTYGLLIAVVMFWFLDISIMVIQAPLRALVSDTIPLKHHNTANGLFGLANGLGAMIGFGLGSWLSYRPGFDFGGRLFMLFTICSLVIVFLSSITLYFTAGEQMQDIGSTSLTELIAARYRDRDTSDDQVALLTHDEDADADDSKDDVKEDEIEQKTAEAAEVPTPAEPAQPVDSPSKWQQICAGVREMPRPIWRAFTVQFWLYCAMCCCNIYLTDWFGKNITDGEPDSDDQQEVDNYHQGVRYASIGLSIMAVFAMFLSMSVPYICSLLGYKNTWFMFMIMFAVNLITTPFIESVEYAVFMIVMLGLGAAAAQVIGWSIVTQLIAGSEKKGIWSTIFHCAMFGPEILVALSAGWFIELFDGDVSSVLAIAGVCALFGANSACYLIEPKNWKLYLVHKEWAMQHQSSMQLRSRPNAVVVEDDYDTDSAVN